LRQAFTLVELLVVIGIIGVLIALLLPAVQSARESARRTSCQNHLMQLGLALQLYHLTHEALPPGVRDDAGPIRHEPKGKHYSWLTQILPYVEQANAYEKIDFDAGVYSRANLPVRKLSISILACPSHRSDGPASDYAGCHHDVEAPIDANSHGVLFLNSSLRFDQIADGRAYTLLVGEKLTEEDAEKAMPEFFEGGLDFIPGDESFDGDPALSSGESSQPPSPDEPAMPEEPLWSLNPAAPTDFGWMSGTRATLRNTGAPINQRRRLKILSGPYQPPPELLLDDGAAAAQLDDGAAAAQAAAQLLHVGGFESNHNHGTQFVFADGSVRFISEQISSSVYQQLGHRADGQLLDDSAY
jgi:prepilin-type N-terminal cleavage/methylation domain-containing protein/prepilin-type processing-associated H-X9-DG protein